MPEQPRGDDDHAGLWVVIPVIAALVCCAAPVLLAGLGVSVSGLALACALRSPWLAILATVALVLLGRELLRRRRRIRRRDERR